MPNWNSSAPFEIIAAPLTVYWGDVGAVFPLPWATPDTNDWNLVGTSGELNYMDSGVTIRHRQTVVRFRALGDTGSRKMFRTEEDLEVSLVLADLTLEQYRLSMNMNAITTVPNGGNPGYKTIGLSRGPAVSTFALLIRGASPYLANVNLQYEIPIVGHTGEPELVFRKSEPVGLALDFVAQVDSNAAIEDERFGRLRAIHAAVAS